MGIFSMMSESILDVMKSNSKSSATISSTTSVIANDFANGSIRPTTNFSNGSSEMLSSSKNYESIGKMINSITSQIKSKTEFYARVNQFKSYDLVESIVQNVNNDILFKYIDKDLPFYHASCDELSEEENKKFQSFMRKLDIPDVLQENLPDILLYGEVIFKIDWEHNQLDDILNQDKTISIFSRNKFVNVVNIDSKEAHTATDYVSFRLFNMPDKTQILDASGAKYSTRLSRGLFTQGSLERITTLRLLESLMPVTEVANLSSKTQYFMRVPTGTPVKEAYDNVRKYEQMLMALMKTETSKDTNELIQNLTKIKVVPLFGDQQELSSSSLPQQNRIDLSQLNDMRTQVASYMIIPLRYVISSDVTPLDPKYLQNLSFIRRRLGDAIKWIAYCYCHKYHKDKNIDLSDIKVTTQRVKGAEELDTIDFMQLNNQAMSDLNTYIGAASDLLTNIKPDIVDTAALIDILNRNVGTLSGTNKKLFKMPEVIPGLSDNPSPDGEAPENPEVNMDGETPPPSTDNGAPQPSDNSFMNTY